MTFLLGGDSCHSSAAAVAPKKKIQTTLTDLVVKGADLIIQETQQKLGNCFLILYFFLQIKYVVFSIEMKMVTVFHALSYKYPLITIASE